MGSLLLELLPSAVGLAITPAAVATNILFLGSRHPVANALGFAAPFALLYSGLSLLVLLAAGVASEPLIGSRTKHLVSTAVGLVLLAGALATVLRRDRPSPRKSRLLRAVDAASPYAAFGIGFVLALLNPNVAILLAGLGVVAAYDGPLAHQIVGAAFLVVSSVVLLLGPTLWYVVSPRTAAPRLASVTRWIDGHQQALNLGVLLVFGTIFTVSGLAGLA